MILIIVDSVCSRYRYTMNGCVGVYIVSDVYVFALSVRNLFISVYMYHTVNQCSDIPHHKDFILFRSSIIIFLAGSSFQDLSFSSVIFLQCAGGACFPIIITSAKMARRMTTLLGLR